MGATRVIARKIESEAFLGERKWHKFLTQTDIDKAAQKELTNQIDFRDISSELDGYGWKPDSLLVKKLGLSRNDGIDPICCLVLDGLASYLELCCGSEPDELHFELDQALRPLDVINGARGYATRFMMLEALQLLAEEVVDYLVNFYFPSREFGITVELINEGLKDSELSAESTVLFRLNSRKIGIGIPESRLIKVDEIQFEPIWKVHNLAPNGALVQLKTRGGLKCAFCSRPSQIRVPVEVAEAISVWQFNPNSKTQDAAFQTLSSSEREILLTGIHEECF